jgi:hypothetical protein
VVALPDQETDQRFSASGGKLQSDVGHLKGRFGVTPHNLSLVRKHIGYLAPGQISQKFIGAVWH